MYFKIHKNPQKCFLTICDEDLIGKQIEENNLFLDVKEDFYKGSSKEIKITEEISSIIFVGKKSIEYGLKNKLLDKTSIKTVKKIPFCEVIFFG